MTVRGLSIRVKLPLFIGALLILVSAIYAAAIYRSVRSASLAVASKRLEEVTDTMAALLTKSRSQLLATARQLGGGWRLDGARSRCCLSRFPGFIIIIGDRRGKGEYEIVGACSHFQVLNCALTA